MMGLMAGSLLAEQSAVTGITADFSAWMASEQRRVYRLCQHMLQDRDEADSATQDVFLKAHRALHRSTPAEPVDPARWLTRIAVNTCVDRLRSQRWQFWRKRPSPQDESVILRLAASHSPGAEDRYFARQIHVRLVAALGRLSTRQRAVFTLRHFEDLSIEQIGTLLDLDTGTVKAHMHRAVMKLRGELRDLYGVRK
jgi:RNA polymerase sigma-70 factor, ECF subfamily